jgi:hypothetical protein
MYSLFSPLGLDISLLYPQLKVKNIFREFVTEHFRSENVITCCNYRCTYIVTHAHTVKIVFMAGSNNMLNNLTVFPYEVEIFFRYCSYELAGAW